jgi:hypothetical protein
MKSHISGIQIPTATRINIDGGLTLDSLAGNSGEMMISQGAGNTPIWSNTLTSPTITTSLLTGSTSFNLLTTTATTINFGLAATTMNIATNNVAKTINIGTGASGGNQTDINIGTSASATTSNINLYGQTLLGKPVTSATTASGFAATLTTQGTSGTGTSGNATGADLYIYSGAAGLSNASNLAGSATSGNLILDVGSATVAYFDGIAAFGNIQIGTGNASSVTVGKSTGTTTINSARMKEPLITSVSTVGGGGSEGGQINFARVTDGAQYWYIDSFGATSTPNLRFVAGNDVRFEVTSAGALSINGQTGSTGQVLTSQGVSTAPTWNTPNLFTSGAGTAPGTTAGTNYPIFPSANDTISLPVGTYRVEFVVRSTVATSTVSSTMNFAIAGAGTAAGSFAFVVQSFAGSGTNGADNIFSVSGFSGTGTVITAASAVAGRNYIAQGNGILRITTAGTIIPSIAWSSSLTSGIVTLDSGNYMIITQLSNSGTAASIGGWA